MTMPHSASHSVKLRALMNAQCVGMPGAFNALCGKLIADAGFEAAYISGAATSVSAGVPDVGLLTAADFCRVIREVVDISGLPLIADADTGFGEAEMVRRTVIDYHRAGAAGLHIEDQKFPKRCGHLDGKELIPLDHACEKVEWASKAARELGDGSFIICARTDARGVEGFDAAVKRAKAYIQAGADMIFPEGLGSESEFAQFASAMGRGPTPAADFPRTKLGGHAPYLLANMTEFGKTPILPLSSFASHGYSCVIWPVSLLRVAMGSVAAALSHLKTDGSVNAVLDKMQTRAQLYQTVGYTPGTPWEARAR